LSYSKLENAKVQITIANLEKIAKCLEVAIDYLLCQKNEMNAIDLMKANNA
jgi:transcriptional regulator with XRE-family HTH domain